MSILEAVLLGLLQGLTEFLPVSSTAHLTLAGHALGLLEPHESWTAFLAVVQVGTLVAVVAYFWRDLWRMARAVVAPRADPAGARLAWLVVLGTVPIVVLGLALRDVIEGPLTKSLVVIAGALIGLGIVLLVAERVGRRERGIAQLTVRDAVIVGLAQAVALVPGASRSGTTLAGGLFAGLEREAAARFSFLLSVPAIAGSALFELPDALAAPQVGLAPLGVAVLAAAVSGYLAIEGLLRFLRRKPTYVFVGYRVALGAAILGGIAAGVV